MIEDILKVHQGTCVLLEVSSLNSLVHYFQSKHSNDIFSRVGEISKVQNSTLFQSHACETRKFKVKLHCSYPFTLLLCNEIMSLLQFKHI